MNGRAMAIRWSILAALGCVLATTGSARAGNCTNDVDCPNAACGGDVCDYSTGVQTCKAAGTQPKGSDGWCTVDSDCKCASMGATCAYPYCTFTKVGGTTGGGGKGGATGAAGSGPTATGGAAAAGHTGSTDGGSSGGCSVAGSRAPATWLAFSVAAGLAIAVRRRRRAR